DIIGLNWYQKIQNKYIMDHEHNDPDKNLDFLTQEKSFAKTVNDFYLSANKPILISEGDHGESSNGSIYDCSGTVGNTIDVMAFGFTGVGGFYTWVGKDRHQSDTWPIIIRGQHHM